MLERELRRPNKEQLRKLEISDAIVRYLAEQNVSFSEVGEILSIVQSKICNCCVSYEKEE